MNDASLFGLITLGCIIGLYLIYNTRKNPTPVSPMDLIVDHHTGKMSYKKIALNTAALLQSFTWLRMSLGLPVHTALENPTMWVIFYAVVAGHDLLGKVVALKLGSAPSNDKHSEPL